LSGVRTAQLSGQIIANIEERAADAERKAGEADDRAFANKKEAEQLRKDAESERLARVKIEASVAWRRIDQKAQHEIASRLNHFRKQSALISYNPGDIEADTFGSDLAATLHAATWDVSEPLGILKIREGPVPFGTNPSLPTGVVIWHTPDKASKSAAEQLQKELTTYGFDAVISAEAGSLLEIHPTPTRVVISVEPRPLGPQGEYKLQAEQRTKAKNKSQQ
jgi:hypothetical protein